MPAAGDAVTSRHVTAWRIGAAGEVRTQAQLEPLQSEGAVTLHDRRIPNSRANIDHIVVSRAGIVVVETKNWSGTVSSRRGELTVKGRVRAGVPDQVRRQLDVVRDAVSDVPGASALVRGVICIHGARLPWFGLTVGGIPVVGPGQLARAIRRGAPALSSPEVERIAALLADRLPSAVPDPAGPPQPF